MSPSYDALLVLSFGGPEKAEDVIGFLENVLRGKNVPPDRIREVAGHYEHFKGVSPINAQNRALIRRLGRELEQHAEELNVCRGLPIYFGNRNWHPLLGDTLHQMTRDGIRRALVFVTSAFSSYSSCRQYLEDLEQARRQVGPLAPQLDKLRAFFNHPGFIESVADRVHAAIKKLPTTARRRAPLVFTAHSIPCAMATTCKYETQLAEACCLVCEQLGRQDWSLVYQSRSGPPTEPWLEPDIVDHLAQLAHAGLHRDVLVVPIGFLSDHIEVLYDLDIEAKQQCAQLGINMVRAATVGTHPRFVAMIRQLIAERACDTPDRLALGRLGARHDNCPLDCCPRN